MGPTWLPSIGKASLLLEYLTTFEDVNESSAAYTQTLLSMIGFTEIIPPQGGYWKYDDKILYNPHKLQVYKRSLNLKTVKPPPLYLPQPLLSPTSTYWAFPLSKYLKPLQYY